MTTPDRSPMWDADGRWVGAAAPAEAPTPPPEPDPVARTAGGCLFLVALLLLVPALLLGFLTLSSALNGQSASTEATVVDISPGVDDFGDATPYCYTVRYEVDGSAYTYRTCRTAGEPSLATGDGADTKADSDRRFAAAHPVGSRVKVLYEVDDPSRAHGSVTALDAHHIGGGRQLTTYAGLGALAFLTAAAVVFRAGRRRWRRSRVGG